MTLSNRKSRPISVDGFDYRWSFSDSLCSETDTHKLNVTVQAASGNGGKVIATGRCSTTEYFLDPSLIVTPRIVAKLIKEAIDQGWNPNANQDFHIKELEQFES